MGEDTGPDNPHEEWSVGTVDVPGGLGHIEVGRHFCGSCDHPGGLVTLGVTFDDRDTGGFLTEDEAARTIAVMTQALEDLRSGASQ